MEQQYLQIITTFFAIISALATVIYTFITIKTLKEIKLQRETTYLPNLVLGDSFFTMYISENLNLNDIEFEEINSKKRLKDCKLKIYNIGFASAKDVKVSFEINNESFFQIIKENYPDFKIELKNDFVFYEYDKLREGHNLLAQTSKEIEFLLPVNNNTEPFYVEIPSYFIRILSLITYKIDDYDILQELITFKFNIKLKDLANKEHNVSYLLGFNIFSMSKTDTIFEIVKINYI